MIVLVIVILFLIVIGVPSITIMNKITITKSRAFVTAPIPSADHADAGNHRAARQSEIRNAQSEIGIGASADIFLPASCWRGE